MTTLPVEYLAILKASYDYAPQSDDEVAIQEDQILYLIERVDDDWWKVKIKGQTQEENSPSGLVPAAYVEQADHGSVAVALYEYEAAAPGELSIKEDQRLLVFDQEDEWMLVQVESPGGKAGWVPGNYIEVASETSTTPAPVPAISASSIVIPPSPPQPTRPLSTYVDPADRVASSKVRSDDIKTWSVSEVDNKGKKKKGTLGVGNGAVFFASESDKTPVQKWPTSNVERVSVEKSKHVHVDIGGATPINLHFSTGSRDIADEILEKLNASRALSASASPEPENTATTTTPSTRFVPPIRSDTPKAVHFSPASPSIIPPREEDDDEEEEEQAQADMAMALYDFDADGEDELSVKEGEKLVILEKDGDEWWKCRNAKGKEGVVPASYVEAAKDDSNNQSNREEELATQRAEEQRLEKLKQDNERARKEKEREKEIKIQQEKERKKTEAEARAKEAAEAAEADRIRRKEQTKQQSQHRSNSSSGGSQSGSGRPSVDNGVPSPEKTRVWHDRTGQFRVEAAFLGFNNGKLRLHKVNGVIVEVPSERMSPEDLRYVEKMTSKRPRSSGSSRPRVSDDDVPLALTEAATRAPNRSSTSGPKKGSSFDWFDFFLSAGCDMDDCTRYASSFERDKMDETILSDITESVMRSLGLREGDIIRVKKAIEKRKPKEDIHIASAVSTGPASPPPNLFAGPGGALKNNAPRRRPQPSKSLPAAVDMNTLSSVSEQIQRTSSPQVLSAETRASPSPVQPPARSSSTVLVPSGFDDDAWTNRPSSTKPPTPAPTAPLNGGISQTPPVAPPAPTPPPAPASAPPAPVAPTITTPAPQVSTTPSLASTTESDIFNQLSRLSQLRVANPPPTPPTQAASPSILTPPVGYQNGLGMGASPVSMGQHLQAAAMGGYTSPPPQQQQQQQPYNGPRGPFAPVPANQGLLQPLIPTQTGFNSFIPTRPSQPQATGFNPQPTGFPSHPPSFSPQPPSFNPSPMMSQPTGMFGVASMQGGAAGFSPAFNQGFNPAQSNGLQPNLAPNPTGFGMGFNQSFANGVPPAPQPTPNVNNTNPANIFAQMKSGTFANGNDSSSPQAPGKYDALRPTIPSQPTGWGGYQGNYGGF